MSTADDVVRAHLGESLEATGRMRTESVTALAAAATRLSAVLAAGGTIYLCGNGGSAADAQHVAAELVGRFQRERQALPAVALTTNTSILTAVGNDYGFEFIFGRQVEASVTARDAVVGISTSGRSVNVVRALEAARARGAFTLAFTGEDDGPLAGSADAAFRAPARRTARIQECHILAWHIICDLIEQSLPAAPRGADPLKG